MKKIISSTLLSLCLVSLSAQVLATGPYPSKIEALQTIDIGHDLNTVHLILDITDSPCSSTNAHDRFTITNNAQHSVILAALMADKTITIYGTGTCNSLNVEAIADLRIYP